MRLFTLVVLVVALTAFGSASAQSTLVDTTASPWMPSSAATASSVPPPYPIIFVHGLSSDDLTWRPTVEHLQAEGWGAPYSYHFDLNASSSTQYINDVGGVGPLSYWDYMPRLGLLDSTAAVGLASRTAGGPNTHLFLVNFRNYYNAATNFLTIRHDREVAGRSESNCSAIAKQGYALSLVIDNVIEQTGAERVILMGHSMGGLAIREYLQRRGVDGHPSWWVDPDAGPNGHRVAAVVTTGTPHQGSNTWDFGLLRCSDSEAMRDLRYSYFTTGETAPYLYGGSEAIQAYWHNDDVNADGDEVDVVQGLNSGNPNNVLATDNPSIPLPENIAYTYIYSGSSWSAGTGYDDSVVAMQRQYIVETGPDGHLYYAPYGSAVGVRRDRCHTCQTSDAEFIEQVLQNAVVVGNEQEPVGGLISASVYPNPTRGRLTISFETPEAVSVGLFVADVLGRVVLTEAPVKVPAGSQSLSLDTSGLPTGVYSVTLTMDGIPQSGQQVTVIR